MRIRALSIVCLALQLGWLLACNSGSASQKDSGLAAQSGSGGRDSADDSGTPQMDSGTAFDAGTRSDGGDASSGSDAALPEVQGLYAEYFDGYYDNLVSRIEPMLDHDWQDDAPAPGIGPDRFSVRFSGKLTPVLTAPTTLAIDADDGVRLWIDDELVIDDWRAHFVERHTATVDLVADRAVTIRVDYFEADLDASLRLSWSAGTELPEEIIPSDRFTTIAQPRGLRGPKPPFANPVMAFDCPDPGVLGIGDDFYAVCTGGTFPIRTSRGLVTWSDVPNASILPDGKPAWADNGGRNWAPELHRAGATFLAYYTSVNASDVLSIGVATASQITGPYTDKGAPLVEHAQGVIDATFFEDDDDSRWLFYKIDGNAHGDPTPIFVRELTGSGTSFAAGSTETEALTNDSSTWEGGVIEAPWVIKRDGYYYLFYSGNVYDHRYRTGVARATDIQGPWEKHGDPLLVNNTSWVGPGHGSVVRVSDIDYFVYHAWQNAGDDTAISANGRHVLVDRITWTDGWPSIANGSPSTTSQPWPGETF